MKAGVLFSGGKDSSLAAILLSENYEVELITFVFSPESVIPQIEQAAAALGFPHKKQIFKPGFLNEAVEMMLERGNPGDTIQRIHREAVRALCDRYDVIGDGTRFGDRVPFLTDDEVRSISDGHGCSYVRPLIGYPKREVQRLAARYLVVIYGETGQIRSGDYEHEIRRELEKRGIPVSSLFPRDHEQSLVTGRQSSGDIA
ncbi:MAG: alpha hydrolase [Methanomicrobiales archaeon HGW-Methanomicrobiales-4]|nr:MAG: alpha hydrolase [Methanomicrobiales archaeon HGW-Methanomicrobiales-4]